MSEVATLQQGLLQSFKVRDPDQGAQKMAQAISVFTGDPSQSLTGQATTGTPADGQIIFWDEANSRWFFADPPGSGDTYIGIGIDPLVPIHVKADSPQIRWQADSGTVYSELGSDTGYGYVNVQNAVTNIFGIQNDGVEFSRFCFDTSNGAKFWINDGGISKPTQLLVEGSYPYANFVTDSHSMFHILGYAHDNVNLVFDGYYNGSSWISSDVGSNFAIAKTGDALKFRYGSGVVAGSSISWDQAMTIASTGAVDVDGDLTCGTLGVDGDVTISEGALSVTDASTTFINLKSSTSGGAAAVQIGHGGTGDRFAYIDLIGDSTYTDYGLRVIRNNSGVNTSSEIIHRGTGDFQIKSRDAGAIKLVTNNTMRVMVGSAGGVGIGGGAPTSAKVYISGNFAFGWSAYIENLGNNTNRLGIVSKCGGDGSSSMVYNYLCYDGSTVNHGGLRVNSGTVEVYQNSDRCLKKDIEDSSVDALSLINQTKVSEFRFKRQSDKEEKTLGFVAQDCKHIPAMAQDGPEGTMTIAQSRMIPVLVKAVQELSKQLDLVKAEFILSGKSKLA